MDPGFTQDGQAEGGFSQGHRVRATLANHALHFVLPTTAHKTLLLQVHTSNAAMTQVPLRLPVGIAVSHSAVIRCLASQSLLTVDPKQQPAA